ncbi:hypothetical protein ILYODFUR_010460 [Ilyodon furcidens]|uniref:Uncharacterized protein n=1 Tax=Ilyodon furcidens TaxID=33524 RepID=A0ABV0SK38_9TELE
MCLRGDQFGQPCLNLFSLNTNVEVILKGIFGWDLSTKEVVFFGPSIQFLYPLLPMQKEPPGPSCCKATMLTTVLPCSPACLSLLLSRNHIHTVHGQMHKHSSSVHPSFWGSRERVVPISNVRWGES